MNIRLKILYPVPAWAMAVLLPALLCLPAGAAGAGVFNPQTFSLANGMQVVVVPNHRVPVVTHMVWYKTGSADEPAGKSGIAHLLEHLMFKGTAKRASGEFSKIVARNGGSENAFTSHDYTAYFQNIAKDRLEMVMELEADRMTNLALTQEEIDTERLVVLEELSQRTGNNPSAVLRQQATAALYLNHPYRRPIIGWEHELRALALAEVSAFYQRWYAPNNAVLVVAGDITADELRPLAEKHYGPIPPSKNVARSRPQEPPHRAARRVVLRDKRVRQPAWSRSFLAPGYASGASQHAYPLEVLEEILDGGATSRLYKSLVVEGKLAVSAGASYGPGGLGPASFTLYASPRPGTDMGALEAAMESQIALILRRGVSEEELSRAKQRLRADAIYVRDSLRTGARVLGAALTSGRTVDDVESWPERIAAVTAEQIHLAAHAVLRAKRSVTALLVGEKGAPGGPQP